MKVKMLAIFALVLFALYALPLFSAEETPVDRLRRDMQKEFRQIKEKQMEILQNQGEIIERLEVIRKTCNIIRGM